jgi:hypothetical protein
MVIGAEPAGLPVLHTALEFTVQLTTSPLAGDQIMTGLLAPALIPFTVHENPGDVPPLTAVAEKVTWLPIHTGLDEDVMETLTG